MKIKRSSGEIKKVGGYIDAKRDVFVVTEDPHNLLLQIPKEISLEEKEANYRKVGELLKKYKPEFLK